MTHAPSKPRRVSACARILAMLKARHHTSLELAKAVPMASRQRVSDLRKAGWNIICRPHPSKAGVNVYILLHGPRGTR